MARMYLMSGMSGSGKTTFAQKFAAENHLQYLCIDDFYALMNGDEKRHEDEHYVWQVFFLAIHLAEEHGRDIIIDTNAPTKSKRIEFLDWFPNFEHHLIFIEASEELCIKNNASRNRQIPIDEMDRMFSELEHPMSSEDRRWNSISVYRNEDNKEFNLLAQFRYNALEGGWCL